MWYTNICGDILTVPWPDSCIILADPASLFILDTHQPFIFLSENLWFLMRKIGGYPRIHNAAVLWIHRYSLKILIPVCNTILYLECAERLCPPLDSQMEGLDTFREGMQLPTFLKQLNFQMDSPSSSASLAYRNLLKIHVALPKQVEFLGKGGGQQVTLRSTCHRGRLNFNTLNLWTDYFIMMIVARPRPMVCSLEEKLALEFFLEWTGYRCWSSWRQAGWFGACLLDKNESRCRGLTIFIWRVRDFGY